MKKYTLHCHKQLGLSLIEMMVSMVLGLFLVGGLSMMYLHTRDSDKTRRAVSEVEANARLAMEFLNLGIEHAGYRSIYVIPFDKPFYSEKDGLLPNPVCRGGGLGNKLIKTPLTIPFSKEGTGTKSDQITSVFLPDNPDDAKNTVSRSRIFSDCTDTQITQACSADPENGMPNPMDSKIYNAYYIDEDNQQLVCIGSRNPKNAPMLIADNIENMQIRYGVISGDQTSYKTAKKVDDANEWSKVSSVQIAILVKSSKDVFAKDGPDIYTLLNQNVAIDDKDRKKIHRVYETTINLVNRNN